MAKKESAKDKNREQMIEKLTRIFQEKDIKGQCSRISWEIIPIIYQLNQKLSKNEDRGVIDNVTWRAKSPESIVRKLEHKGKDVNLDNALYQMNDIAGIRVVCSFMDDVYVVTDEIKNIPGIKIIKEKNYIDHPKRSGYRSIHLIIDVSDRGLDVRQLEIQIRSVAMNYWAILDHQLVYKNNSKTAKKMRKKLKSYAEEIAEIDWQMLMMRKEIETIDEE